MASVPDTMRAVVYDRPERVEIRTVPTPRPAPDEVLLRVEAAGVCGTDLHLHVGEFGPTYPLTPGHEFTGRAVATGDAALEPMLGHRFAVDNTSACGGCPECLRARPAFCRRLLARGVNRPGGFAEYVAVPATRCFRADDLDPEVAVFAEPVACVVHGIDVLAPQPGSAILLFGAGPTGLVLTQLLGRVAAHLTVAAPTAAKLAIAQRLGADAVVQLDRTAPQSSLERLREAAPDGYDIVVDATGAPPVLDLTLPLTRTGGTVFVYGMPPESARWSVPSYDLFRRELTIKTSFAQQYSFDRALAYLRSGRVDTSGLITHRFGLDDYTAALDTVSSSESVKVVLRP